jgi:hypothetical protein
MNEAAEPGLPILAVVLALLVLGGLVLGLLRRRGPAAAPSQNCHGRVRACRVRGGQPGRRLSQAADKDCLLIRTPGLAVVFAGQVAPGVLKVEETVASELWPEDLVLVEAGQMVPCGCELVGGAAAIYEAAMTGVSWPVFREAGGPHSHVLRGTFVVSGRMIVRVAG